MIYSNISTSTLNYKLYYFYLIEGSTLCAINTILTVFIIFNKNLRSQKEYIIYGANFFYNAIYSLGFAGSGALRLSVYYNEECKNHLFKKLQGVPKVRVHHRFSHTQDEVIDLRGCFCKKL